jgi:hypothetical protein
MDFVSLNKLTVTKLKEICLEQNIPLKGIIRKAELIHLILNIPNTDTSQPKFVVSRGSLPEPVSKRPRGVAAGAAAAAGDGDDGDDDDDDDDDGDRTPTTAKSKKRIAKFDRTGNVWFETSFLEAALNERLSLSSGQVGQANPTPTLFILVGPASVGKSSSKRLIPEMNYYAINVDVDEIKLYGNDVLPKHSNPKKKGEMLSDVEGIQFKYDLVLEKLRPMVFQNATMFGEGNYKNIILDTTGSMSEQIKMYIRTAKLTYNYTVKVIIVYSDKIQCLQRVTVRNRELFAKGQGTRYIPPRVVSGMYDTFLKKNQAGLYAMSERMVELTDELILVDNHYAQAKIVARRTRDSLQIFRDITDEDSIVGVDGAFYGLTLNPGDGDQPASIVQGDIQAQITKAEREWTLFDEAEKRAKEEREVAKKAMELALPGGSDMGGSRKRRISKRRRIRGTRIRKTVKKYYHPHTRRSHHRRHSHRR